MYPAKNFLIIFFIIGSCLTGIAQVSQFPAFTSFKIPENTRQIIVVTTASWTAKDGELQRYERLNGDWVKKGEEIIVAVGKNGVGWGRGLHKNTGEVEKKEGDGKAPAGVFALGTMFGYDEHSPSSLSYPYRQSTVRDYFVDDVNSVDYNRWISIDADKQNNPQARWASYEKMKRADHLYKYGIVILHNSAPVEKGKGSAIFFHVWRSPGAATLGCTSMSEEDLLELIKWLDPKMEPLLIQAPKGEINTIRQ